MHAVLWDSFLAGVVLVGVLDAVVRLFAFVQRRRGVGLFKSVD